MSEKITQASIEYSVGEVTNPFEGILDNALTTNTLNEAQKAKIEAADKELIWKQKRAGKITSSKNPDLMASGKGKDEEWGETAKKVLLSVLHERITGIERPNFDLYQFRWGNENESEAIKYYNKIASNLHPNIISGAEGYEEILFLEPFKGYGDSPDAVSACGTITAEIKCPENGAVHLEYCAINEIYSSQYIEEYNKIKGVKKIKQLKYYWQLIGHFLAAPRAKELHFISFDPRFPDLHPLKMHIVKMHRVLFEEDIARLRGRVLQALYVLDIAEKENNPQIILNINNADSVSANN